MKKLSKQELEFVISFLDKNREFLTNNEIIKEVFKESCGKITLDFDSLETILYEFNFSNNRKKHYREHISNIKRYIKNNEKYRRQMWENRES